MTNHEARADKDISQSFEAWRPPQRIPIAEAVASTLFVAQPGDVPAYWSPDKTPYMPEPMNCLASRKHEAVIFVGPSRTGKTLGMLVGWMAHAVVNDPGDMLFIQMTQDKAREFSKTDIDRALRSDKLKALMGGAHDDTIHDKMFRHGMYLRIGWPTISNVSGSTYRYVAITDLDRMGNAENVDGEGPLFTLALKRTQTFLSRGMCLVESSPGIEITDPHWTPATKHEGPPVTGVIGLYNQGDRRRQYWRCPHCAEFFQASPGLELFRLPSEDTLLEIVREADLAALAKEYNRIICPHCAAMIGPKEKNRMNATGRWLKDGLSITKSGEIVGQAHESTIASFWLGGVAAAYQSWQSMIMRYLQAVRHYVMTSNEEQVRTAVNTDQGMPYMSFALKKAAKNKDPAARKEHALEKYIVPSAARFVVVCVDVQKGYFCVQAHAVGVHREKWIIDRYNIRESMRPGVGAEFAPIDPARYAEDWDVLTEHILRSTYRTETPGVELRILQLVVDSGGEEGVTERAYAYLRRVGRLGYGGRVMLTKGAGRKYTANMPMINETMVGGRNPKERGDIPLYMLNSNMLKDVIQNGLDREESGPGFIHIPGWLPQSVLDELQSEIRQDDGTWEQVRARNEIRDLLVMCEAACLRLGAERLDWSKPPPWAALIDQNDQRITSDERRAMKTNELVEIKPEDKVPEPAPIHAKRREPIRSGYLS